MLYNTSVKVTKFKIYEHSCIFHVEQECGKKTVFHFFKYAINVNALKNVGHIHLLSDKIRIL